MSEWLAVGVVHAGLLVTFAMTIGWIYYIAFWVAPLFTLTRWLMGLRNISEHAEQNSFDCAEQRFLNSIYCGATERFFIGPLGFNFHAEHHLFPSIPTLKLRDVSPLLKGHPWFEEHVRSRSSYFDVYRDLR